MENSLNAGKVRSRFRELTLLFIDRNLTVSTMESCTGGLLASLFTDTEGSSAVFRGSYVTYSNEQKIRLGVPADTIEKHGVYSNQTSNAMARVCAQAFGTDISIGVTGTFSNVDPANDDSVPGEVYFSIYRKGRIRDYRCTVPALPSRSACKLLIADVVADRLLEEFS